MNPYWAYAMVAGMLVELVAMFVFPLAYARLAFIPCDRRAEPLPRRVAPSGYRDAPAVPLNVAALGLDGFTYEDDETVGAFAGGRGWLRMRYKFFGWNRVMGIVSVVPGVSDDRLQLTARVYPAFTISLLGSAFAMGNPRIIVVLLAAMVVSVLVSTMMLRSRVRVPLSRFQDELASRAKRHLAETP
ncbi:MAG: hypothetical protein R3B40_02050 [Polyangiales bacterium]|nr:hypothetical protein [Sandaracinaceae bacterium]